MDERDAQVLRALQAAIYGEAIGDALGVPYEFKERDTFTCTTMIGYGTHNKPAGTYSDDTAMTLATLDSLLHCDGCVDVVDMRNRYCDWLFDGKYTADGVVFDVGNGTYRALQEGRGLNAERHNGNGSLMRSIPFAFFDVDDDEIREASAITHAHDISMDACVAYVHAARVLLDAGCPTQYSEHDTARLACEAARAAGYDKIWLTPREEIRSSGYVLHTLPAALWCLTTTDSYSQCVLEAVNLGEDTDTTAAVAGALAGILYGFEDDRSDGRGIPGQWDDTLQGWDVIADVISGGPLDAEDWNTPTVPVLRTGSARERGDTYVLEAMLCTNPAQRTQLFEQAAIAFRSGIELGDGECATNLGTLYLYGHLHEENADAKAFACFMQGARMGNAESACYVGDMYRDGRGTNKDADEAFTNYELACTLIPRSLSREIPADCVIIAMIHLRLGDAYSWRLEDSDELVRARRNDIRANALAHYAQAERFAQKAYDAGLRMNVKELMLARAGQERLSDSDESA